MTDVAPRLQPRGREAAAVFAAALILRLLFLWVVPSPSLETPDQPDYDRLARGILDGRGYVAPSGLPTSERPPLYPYMLAGVYALFEDGPPAVRVVQATVDAITCLLVYLLAARHFGVQVARIAAVLALVSLSQMFATLYLMTESLSTFFMVATVFALDVALAGWRPMAFAAAGVLVGLGTLTKGTTLLMPPALLIPIWVAAQRNWRRTAGAGALLLAAFALTLAPWTIRNYRVHGELVPLATQVGWVMYSSYVPSQGFGNYTIDDNVIASRALPEPEASRFLMRATGDHVRAHPGELPRLMVLRVLFFLGPFDWGFLGADAVFNFTYALSALLAVYGLATMRWNDWRPILLVTPLCFMLVQALWIFSSQRMRMPLEPLLIVLAAAGIATAWHRASHHRGLFVTASAAVVATGFAAYWFSAAVKDVSAQALRNIGLW
jgi:4-amino-4-deoxy-L-arabinose transferase-like glycosyltransferase